MSYRYVPNRYRTFPNRSVPNRDRSVRNRSCPNRCLLAIAAGLAFVASSTGLSSIKPTPASAAPNVGVGLGLGLVRVSNGLHLSTRFAADGDEMEWAIIRSSPNAGLALIFSRLYPVSRFP